MVRLTETVERWGIFEMKANGPAERNSLADTGWRAEFRKGHRVFEAEGFYDGAGNCRLRFMPDEEGDWSFRTASVAAALDGIAGEFRCVPASPGNHGPVRTIGTHFGYADGTPYVPFGTTLLAWHVQDEERRRQTIRTLEQSPFNKVRMSLIPPSEAVPADGEKAAPFAALAEGGLDGERFEPAYFARLETCVEELSRLGIEVELILFPGGLEKWGLDRLAPEREADYIRYAAARLAAYRNVWWSMAETGGEHGCRKEPAAWERLFRTLRECDYGRHLRSIHAPAASQDWGLPWLTHASIRHEDVKLISDYTQHYEKPIVADDCGREGIGPPRRDGLTAEEMAYRIWEGVSRGGFVAHGESLKQPDGRCWSIHGGALLGESRDRIAFLRGLLEDAPSGLEYGRERHDASTLERKGVYYLQYFGPHRFSSRTFAMSDGQFAADVIDTWSMTIRPMERSYEHRFRIDLPGQSFHALRIRRIGDGTGTGAGRTEYAEQPTENDE